MAKPTDTIGPASQSADLGPRAKRAAKSGAFVLGRQAFGKVSAVEGIAPSASLEADLARLEGVPSERRVAVLAGKYGKG